MKKILLIIVFCLFLCGCKIDKATDVVKNYLSLYQNQDAKIMKELDQLISGEELKEEEKKLYKEIMIKQYKDLNYEIKKESYDGNKAIITVEIKVYDLYGAQKKAENYRNLHGNEFKDYEDYLKYKLEMMYKNTERMIYTLEFVVNKEDNEWILESVPTKNLEKIHGIYNYETD